MAILGINGKVSYEDGSGFTEVPNCKSISFPALAISSVDSTPLSASDFARTFFAGLIDAGSIVVECEYTSDVYGILYSIAVARENIGWKVESPEASDGTVFECSGHVTKLDSVMTPDAEMMINFEIKMTGLPSI